MITPTDAFCQRAPGPGSGRTARRCRRPTPQTDGEGLFLIQPAPVGKFKLCIEGGTAQHPGTWPTLECDLVTIAGQNNTVHCPFTCCR